MELLRVEMKTMLFHDLQDGLNKTVVSAVDESGNAREGGEWCYGIRARVLGKRHRGNVLVNKGWH